MNESPTKREPSAVAWLDRLQRGELSAVELFQRVVQRIEAADRDVHAVIADNYAQGLEQAKAADARRARGEQAPLLGLPVTIKDSIDVAGLPCTGGSLARADFMPPRDASAAARLRAAGAVVVAKTNLPEYSSSYETDNAVFGRTNHPLDASRTPGGSSGGEGALLGADASIVGLGADGGGSIRVPSHYCGTCGIRPTVGLVPETGAWPATRDTGYRDLMCIGPMARYVEDLALLLPIIAGPDGIDPYAVVPWRGHGGASDTDRLRIGFYEHDGVAEVSPGTRAAVRAAVQALAAAGAEVSEAPPPGAEEATEIFFSLAGADGGVRTLKDVAAAGGRHHEQFQTLLDGFGASLTLPEFFDLQERSFRFRARMRAYLQRFDAVIAPVTTGPAPRHMETPYGIPQGDYFRYQAFNYTHTFALAGVPVAAVPAGGEDGLPLGVQVAAQPHRDSVALAVAALLEGAL